MVEFDDGFILSVDELKVLLDDKSEYLKYIMDNRLAFEKHESEILILN